MIINRCSIQDYPNKRELVLTINSFWVKVQHHGEIIYKREPQQDSWMDASHTRITNALNELERAVRDACDTLKQGE